MKTIPKKPYQGGCTKRSTRKNTKTTAAVFPRGSKKRTSNNDDQHDHGQEKRRPSTLCRGKKKGRNPRGPILTPCWINSRISRPATDATRESSFLEQANKTIGSAAVRCTAAAHRLILGWLAGWFVGLSGWLTGGLTAPPHPLPRNSSSPNGWLHRKYLKNGSIYLPIKPRAA